MPRSSSAATIRTLTCSSSSKRRAAANSSSAYSSRIGARRGGLKKRWDICKGGRCWVLQSRKGRSESGGRKLTKTHLRDAKDDIAREKDKAHIIPNAKSTASAHTLIQRKDNDRTSESRRDTVRSSVIIRRGVNPAKKCFFFIGLSLFQSNPCEQWAQTAFRQD